MYCGVPAMTPLRVMLGSVDQLALERLMTSDYLHELLVTVLKEEPDVTAQFDGSGMECNPRFSSGGEVKATGTALAVASPREEWHPVGSGHRLRLA